MLLDGLLESMIVGDFADRVKHGRRSKAYKPTLCDRLGKHLWLWPWQRYQRCGVCGCFSELHAGKRSITMSPGGTLDVVRWSASGVPAQLGDLGMDTTTGRPQAYVSGSAEAMALLSDISGGGGGLVHIETKTFTGGAQQTTTFSSLNGESDELYLFVFRLQNDNGSVAPHYVIRPNGIVGDSATYTSSVAYADDVFTTLTFRDEPSTLYLGECGGNESVCGFSLFSAAHKSGMRRNHTGLFVEYTSSARCNHGRASGKWEDTSTSVTSIEFTSQGGSVNVLGTKSRISLYKFASS